MTDGANVTDGNNVEAGIDRDGIDGVDAPVDGVSRVFDFSYDPSTTEPLTSLYQNGEVTDTFYWTNVYHDRLYLLGFTEAARNFQHDNFGRGGVAGDRITAQSQDSSGTNNANFTTPPDGGRGRMQMYLFPGPNPDRTSGLEHDVLIHELTHGTSNRLHSNASGLTSTMSRGMGEGWSDFYARALLATASEDPNGIYTTGGWLTYQLSPGYTDNYYYGIRRFPYAVMSTVGANGKPHNPLTFADIDAAQINTSDGAHPNNPIIPNTAFQVHNMGEIWCMALLEVRARFISRLGFATGTQRFLQFVTDGMKLDPTNPTFLQGRDSIIAAANAGGGNAADIADIWAGFAVRGMGVSAQIINAGTGTVVEAFDVPGIGAGAGTLITESIPNGRLDPGEAVTVSLCVANNGLSTSGNVTGTLLATGVVTSPSGPQSYGAITPGATECRSYTFTVAPMCLASVAATLQADESGATNRDLVYSFPMGTLSTFFDQDFDGVTLPPPLPAGWTTSTLAGTSNPWVISVAFPHTAPYRALVNNLSTVSDSVLVSPAIALPPGLSQLTFRNIYFVEASFDGGVLEIAIGGGPFEDIILSGGSFVTGGYNGMISNLHGNPIGGRMAWTGDSGTTYTTTTVNLPAAASDQNVQLRWRMASDSNFAAAGWAVDTIVLSSPQCSGDTPTVTGIVPNTGTRGTVFGATITGTNLTAASAVKFSGSGVTATIGGGGSSTSLPITISIGSNAAQGLRTLAVTTPGGTSFPFSGFTVMAAPTITAISPNAAAPGTSFSASILGSNMGGVSAATFSGTGVTATVGTGGSSSVVPVTITIDSEAALGLRTVTVTNPVGTSPPFSGFNVTTTPAITSMFPPRGAIGATFGATIFGNVLTGATAVTFSGTGVTASINGGGTATSLPVTVSVDADALLGARQVTVTSPGGTSNPANIFTVVLPPEITAITPNVGAPATSFWGTITGTSLMGASGVTFSGTGVTASVGTATTSSLPVFVTIDSGALLGTRTVTVTAPGTASPPFTGFDVTTTPLITGITPNEAPAGSSVNATITGSILSGISAVTFSGTGVTAGFGTGGSSTSFPLNISVHPGAILGPRTFTVTSPGGTSLPFGSFTVTAGKRRGQVTSAGLFVDRPKVLLPRRKGE